MVSDYARKNAYNINSRAKPEPSNSFFFFKIEFIYFLELLGM